MGFEGIFFGFSFLFSALPIFLVLAFVVVLALHRDEDTEGNRALAIYGALVAFLGFLALLLAAPIATAALVNFSRETYGGRHDAEATMLITGIIIGVIGAGVLLLHQPLFERLRLATGAAARVRRAYGLVMCLVSVVVGATAGAMALYRAAAMVASDTFGTTSGDAARSFVPSLALLVAAIAIGRWHWDEAEINAAAAP
jgi:hypothetical protein